MQPQPGRRFVVDPLDPRAPPPSVWERLSPEERSAVVQALPCEVPWGLDQPEGDGHRKPKQQACETLDSFVQKTGARLYISSELAVYYPGEPCFCPDLLAVRDVATHRRDRWVVQAEGKGLDLVLEVLHHGDAHKDLRDNVLFYARLRIPEYFVFDVGRGALFGWHLPSSRSRRYHPLLPQAGRFPSTVLGLSLTVEQEHLRFYDGATRLLDPGEAFATLATLETKVQRLVHQRDQETQRRQGAEQRAAAEAEARQVEAAARALAEQKAAAEAEARQVEAEARAQAEARVAELERLLAEREATPPRRPRR